MAKGDGGISEIKRGLWQVCVSFGKDPITGKRRRVKRNVRGTKADARKVRDQIRREHENGLLLEVDKLTFGEFARSWQEARGASGEYAERTLDEDAIMLKYILPHLGSVRLKDITPTTIESLITTLRKEKTRNGKPPSSTTLRRYYVTVKQILKQAVNRDLILRNPCDRVKAPRNASVDRRSLSTEEASRLMRCVDEYERQAYEAISTSKAAQAARGKLFGCIRAPKLHHLSNVLAVRLAMTTGMRLSELLAIPWENVDLESRIVKVTQAITRTRKIKGTKSGKPRKIAIDAETARHLTDWKERQRIELLRLSIEQRGVSMVFCTDAGTIVDATEFERWWRRFRTDNGFPDLKFHELRHTQATQLLANGVDVKTVQARLGHANASTTLDYYAHALSENDQRAADLIAGLFSRKPEKPRILELKSA